MAPGPASKLRLDKPHSVAEFAKERAAAVAKAKQHMAYRNYKATKASGSPSASASQLAGGVAGGYLANKAFGGAIDKYIPGTKSDLDMTKSLFDTGQVKNTAAHMVNQSVGGQIGAGLASKIPVNIPGMAPLARLAGPAAVLLQGGKTIYDTKQAAGANDQATDEMQAQQRQLGKMAAARNARLSGPDDAARNNRLTELQRKKIPGLEAQLRRARKANDPSSSQIQKELDAAVTEQQDILQPKAARPAGPMGPPPPPPEVMEARKRAEAEENYNRDMQAKAAAAQASVAKPRTEYSDEDIADLKAKPGRLQANIADLQQQRAAAVEKKAQEKASAAAKRSASLKATTPEQMAANMEMDAKLAKQYGNRGAGIYVGNDLKANDDEMKSRYYGKGQDGKAFAGGSMTPKEEDAAYRAAQKAQGASDPIKDLDKQIAAKQKEMESAAQIKQLVEGGMTPEEATAAQAAAKAVAPLQGKAEEKQEKQHKEAIKQGEKQQAAINKGTKATEKGAEMTSYASNGVADVIQKENEKAKQNAVVSQTANGVGFGGAPSAGTKSGWTPRMFGGNDVPMNTMPDLFASMFGMASGGKVPGTGPGDRDSVPAMLAPGEFVVNARAAREHMGVLHQMNNNKFAMGGPVIPSPSMARAGGGGFNPKTSLNVRGDSVNKILRSVQRDLGSTLNDMMSTSGTSGRFYGLENG